jgi:hypothetical protein
MIELEKCIRELGAERGPTHDNQTTFTDYTN